MFKVPSLILIFLLSVFVGKKLFWDPSHLEIPVVQAAVPSGIIIAWPSTNGSIPSGWSRVTDLDTYFIQSTTGNPTTNVGGASTHVHTSPAHTHNIGHTHPAALTGQASTGSTLAVTTSTGATDKTHVHSTTFATNTDTGGTNSPTSAQFEGTSNNPPYTEVIWIQSNGTSDVPVGGVVFYNSDTLPTNFTRQFGNTFLKGATAGGNGGGTGGSSDSHNHVGVGHTHIESAHTHTASVGSTGGEVRSGSISNTDYTLASHTHTSSGGSTLATEGTGITATVAAGDAQPPFYKLNFIKNEGASATLPVNTIALWTGTIANIPQFWVLCNGTNGTPNLNARFIKGANANAEIGTTGGALTHTHTAGSGHKHTINIHTHAYTIAAASGTVKKRASGTTSSYANTGHNHTLSITSSGTIDSGTTPVTLDANSDNRPPFKDAVYIQYKPNSPPNTPTNSSPSNGATNVSTNPTLTASAFSDPDTGDTHQASQWQLTTDSGFNSIAWDTGSTNGSTSIGSPLITTDTTYYFDGSDAGATDPNSYWANDSNAFDDDSTPSTFATQGGPSSRIGTTAVGFLMAEGTNAGSINYSTINSVKARIYHQSSPQAGSGTIYASIFTDNLGQDLGTIQDTQSAGSPATWSSYTTLSTPSGGWTLEKLQALEVKVYTSTGVASSESVYKVEISVNGSQPLNNSTVYYWRVRYQDNSSNWSNYSIGTSFTTAAAQAIPNTPSLISPGSITNFDSGVTYPTVGTNPADIVSADFSGDGKDDLAVVNKNSDNMAIFINNGSGSYAAGVTYPAPVGTTQPIAIAAADFNNDGDIDIVTGNNSRDLIVYSNNGSGVFGVGTTYHGNYYPNKIATADFNNDGYIDIAVTGDWYNSVTVLLNDGDGTFTYSNYYDTESRTAGLVSADFNKDGYPDLAATSGEASSVFSVFLNDGDGTFGVGTTYSTLGGYAYSVITGDVDNDGNLDLATVNSTGTIYLTILKGNGNGTFGVGNTYSTSPISYPTDAAFIDFNGDNKLDIIVNNYYDNNVTIFNNDGSGAFSIGSSYPTLGTNAKTITTTDTNHDHNPDLAVINNGDIITVFKNSATLNQSVTPSFKTVATDTNSDTLQYELKYCSNSSMSVGCSTFTASNTGWSGADVGTSSFSSGTTATYVLQTGSSLAEGQIIYWKTRAIDPGGTNVWSGTQTTPYSLSVGSRPNIPTLVSPSTGTTAVSLTPTFKTVTTDPNLDNLQYKIQLCTNEAMSVGCTTYDLTASNTGWSGADVGTSAYSSGTNAYYTIQSNLDTSTTYYWRSYAIDYAGVNRWSNTQSTPNNFTTRNPIPNLTQSSFRWSADDGGENRSSGWLSSWTYRQPVTIANALGTTLTDFQVIVNTGTSGLIGEGKMQSDCDDIRFATSTGTTLPYWIGGGCNTTATQMYVKTDSIGTSGSNSTIYMYYGNSGAGIASNGIDTFDFFDDFDDGSVDTTTRWNKYGTVSESGSTLTSTASFNSHSGVYSKGTTMVDAVIENRWKTISGDILSDERICTFGRASANNVNTAPNGTGAVKMEDGSDSVTNNRHAIWITNSNIARTNWDPTDGTWYQHKTIWNGHDLTFYTIADNWGSVQSTTTTSDANSNLSGYFGLYVYTTSKSAWDWYLVRKLATTEPTISLGTQTTEPSGSGGTWLAAENVGITNVAKNSNVRIRFSAKNTGETDSLNFRLQVAPLGASAGCTGVPNGNFVDVGTTVGSNVAVMTTSPQFTDQSDTTQQLSIGGTNFVAGKMVEYSSNQTNNITLTAGDYTESEYNFQMTNNAGGSTAYCFRLVDVGTTLNTYTQIAQLTTQADNQSPSKPSIPYVNNTTAQSGQTTPVTGLTDHTPAFSAIFDDPDTSDTSSYYQIQVDTSSDFNGTSMWDSNKTSMSSCNENNRCNDITYAGSELTNGSTYYWRIKFWDNSDAASSWSDTQQFTMNNHPIVSSVVINNNNSINLSENTSIGVSWTATITDNDGESDITAATGKIYRSGVGSSCTPNDTNCYSVASCNLSDCATNNCTATCTANIYFFADPTDSGNYIDEYWSAWVQGTDAKSDIGSTTSSSTSIDINTLSAFEIGTSLSFGEVFAGSDTGSSNAVFNITNTGNKIINIEVTGDSMCTDYPTCSQMVTSIEPSYQQFKTTTFVYGNGTTLSYTAQIIGIGISKATDHPSNSSKSLYWGIGVPTGKEPGNYQGKTIMLVD